MLYDFESCKLVGQLVKTASVDRRLDVCLGLQVCASKSQTASITRLRSRSAEEAVTNILYNTPPPSTEPFKKHILNCLVQNEPGVLSRVSGILAARGFNIDSLVVCRTEIQDLSRMCIVLSGQDGVVEQARRQLEDLVPVWAVLDYTDTRTINRELLLVKVSILGPEYLEDQLAGGPSHDPRSHAVVEPPESAIWEGGEGQGQKPYHQHSSKMEREISLATSFEQSGKSTHYPSTNDSPPQGSDANANVTPLTPHQLLTLKSTNLQALSTLSSHFGAKIVDISENSAIIELSAKSERVDAFLGLVKSWGVLEAARTGLMVMPRTPIANMEGEDGAEGASDEGGPVDASLLPPG
ncbi:15705_t:CDS:2 [Acaulospora colombiana]|uniref:15705_t:CDS:1 n=1 Tax=Acaulospora colombiana TaxID=27376 RepID=A0ACA9MGQ0_9GLOM|nr:15705_t:CDS:2 [Acaulospora colombiana]